MTAHTPGPWIVNAEQVFGNGHKIATINQHTSTWLEDRALIEAAPDLLAALKQIVATCGAHPAFTNPNNTITQQRMAQARAAIAKAEGTEP